MILRSLVVLIPMLLGMPGTVFSQVSASYPAKPIRLIVPAAPGATSDVLARLLVEKLQTSLGVSLVVENQAGAGGAIAAAALTRTAPDGYILMLGDTGSISVSVAMNPKLSYHPLKDMTLITNLVIAPPVLVVPASVPAATLQEFIALAKSRPGQLNYGSAGPGSFHHLAMAALVSQAGIDLVHVPYKGGNPMVQGLLAGEVSIGVSGLQNAGQAARAGRLKILGITSPRRIKSQPDIPTLDEQGLRACEKL
ncbi:MAG: tripartite tricarboxylate transporter substrate binding protein [Betaproteobacteria bacterium]|nr:tripartite tricarboxylate transporter substrate binding protein [Betaproteobacteria bacterium]